MAEAACVALGLGGYLLFFDECLGVGGEDGLDEFLAVGDCDGVLGVGGDW